MTSATSPDSAPAAVDDRRSGLELTIRLTWPSLVAIALALALVLGLVAIFEPAEEPVTRIVLGCVLALALDPLVRALQRRGWSRRVAATTVGLGLLAMGVLLLVVVGPPAVEQAERFEAELPETVQGFYDLPLVGDWLRDNDAAGEIERFVDELPATVDDETVADTANSFLGSVLGATLVFFVALAVMLDGEVLVFRIRRLIPRRHRDGADRVGRLLYRTFGNYFGGSITVAVLAGLWVLVIGLIFNVPLAPVAAIWAMVTNVIPQIGGFLGGSFVTILALSVSVPTAIAVGLLFVVYMNFENHILQPAIVGEAVDLSPPASMLAVLIGGAAAGIPGALIATPLVGTIKRLYFVVRFGEDETTAPPSFGDRIRKMFRRGDAEASSDATSAST